MKVYKNGGGYHCFGCGEHGDVISFEQKLFGLSFVDALRKIDSDFSLGLFDGKPSFEENKRQFYEAKIREAKENRRQMELRQAEEAYWAAFAEWCRLDMNRRRYKPKSIDEPISSLYIEALIRIPYQEYLVDILEEERDRLVRTRN